MNKTEEKIARIKILAELFFKDKIKVYIKDIYDSYYFCDIVSVKEEKILVKCFAPTDKAGQEFQIYWANVIELKKYEEQRK